MRAPEMELVKSPICHPQNLLHFDRGSAMLIVTWLEQSQAARTNLPPTSSFLTTDWGRSDESGTYGNNQYTNLIQGSLLQDPPFVRNQGVVVHTTDRL